MVSVNYNSVSRTEIVDRNDLHFPEQFRSLVKGAQYVAANPSVSINCHVDHQFSSPGCKVRGGGFGHTSCKAVTNRANSP